MQITIREVGRVRQAGSHGNIHTFIAEEGTEYDAWEDQLPAGGIAAGDTIECEVVRNKNPSYNDTIKGITKVASSTPAPAAASTQQASAREAIIVRQVAAKIAGGMTTALINGKPAHFFTEAGRPNPEAIMGEFRALMLQVEDMILEERMVLVQDAVAYEEGDK